MNLYYTAPPQEIFDEMKKLAIGIWKGYDDIHGYATEKIDKIKDLENVSDNFMTILAMFDHTNQLKLRYNATVELNQAIKQRLQGVQSEEFDPEWEPADFSGATPGIDR